MSHSFPEPARTTRSCIDFHRLLGWLLCRHGLDIRINTREIEQPLLENRPLGLIMVNKTNPGEDKRARFEGALQQFLSRVSEDRYVLAVVLVGSLTAETIWRTETIQVWVIEADGVTRRLRSDGNEERIHRIFVENGINIHAEVIPRSRFKQMVEGASRTAFSCNFFASREVVYSQDKSIDVWFDQASSIAVKDKERELLAFSTWTIYAARMARKLLVERQDDQLALQELLGAAHSLACTEIIRAGMVCEEIPIHKAIELNPELFQVTYIDLLSGRKSRKALQAALNAVEDYLQQHYQTHLKPLLAFLKKEDRIVPLSEIGDHFAFSQIYPWHLEAACEWLEREGKLQKISMPFKLTKRSQEMLEEPAYYMDK